MTTPKQNFKSNGIQIYCKNSPFIIYSIARLYRNNVSNTNRVDSPEKADNMLTYIDISDAGVQLSMWAECGKYPKFAELYDVSANYDVYTINNKLIDAMTLPIYGVIADAKRYIVDKLAETEKAFKSLIRSDLTYKRFRELRKTIELNDVESDVLLISILHSMGLITTGAEHITNITSLSGKYASFLNCRASEIIDCLSEDSKLIKFGQINELDFTTNPQVVRFMQGLTKKSYLNMYYTEDKTETLPWEYYNESLKKHGEMLKSMLQKRSTGHGINILLYGATGAGKTSFANTLCKNIEHRRFLVNNNGAGTCGGNRFHGIRIATAQVYDGTNVIIVDEADNLLQSGSYTYQNTGHAGDKTILNTILDEAKCPIIWISNTAMYELDPSSRRRFDYSIKFDELSCEQRKIIWKNCISKFKLGKNFTDDMIDRLAMKYSISAGGISNTLKNVRNMKISKNETEDTVISLLKPHCELMGIQENQDRTILPSKDYSLNGLNVSGVPNLDVVIRAVKKFRYDVTNSKSASADVPRMNILLSGIPGTGKTEFVKYLASVLGVKVNVKLGSDLINMYVGETEQRIKQAFSDSKEGNEILFLDEIDGMLQSRDRSRNSWEVTQVNELLQQMENFGGIFIAATNYLENLDPAAIRRFTFKIQFNPLNTDGKKIMFETLFKTTLSDTDRKRLNTIDNLTPGDFRTVRQSQYYMDIEPDNEMRIKALEDEVKAKIISGFTKHTKMGFA